jgi:hypothetical protein
MKSIEALIRELPPDLQQEVEDFIRSIIRKRKRTTGRQLSLSWRGALSDLRDKYTSVELQHEILKHWGD